MRTNNKLSIYGAKENIVIQLQGLLYVMHYSSWCVFAFHRVLTSFYVFIFLLHYFLLFQHHPQAIEMQGYSWTAPLWELVNMILAFYAPRLTEPCLALLSGSLSVCSRKRLSAKTWPCKTTNKQKAFAIYFLSSETEIALPRGGLLYSNRQLCSTHIPQNR